MKKLLSYTVAAIFCVLISTQYAAAAPAAPIKDWKNVISTLSDFQKQHRSDVNEALSLAKQDKTQLKTTLSTLKKETKKTEKNVDALIAKYNALLKKEAKITKELQSRKEEIKTFEGTVRSSAKLMQERASLSFLTQQNPQRLEAFNTLLAQDRMPGLADLQKLIEMYFNELAATATISRYSTTIIDDNGVETNAEIIRAGTASAIYKTQGDKFGFLQLVGDGSSSKSITDMPSGLTSVIEDSFSGAATHPLDFSHGAAFVRFVADKDIWSKIKDGGVLVWPILGIGALALLLALERALSLGKIRRTSSNELDEIIDLAQKKNWNECFEILSARSTPTKRVLWATLKKFKGSTAAIEKGMQEALLVELTKMERFLPTMQTLAAVAPLLGLLGTVSGMINTFQVITLFGTGDPHMLSGGISEALVTTQLGLAVAIPIMVLHHMLNSRVDTLANDMEEKGTALIATILNGR